MEKLISEGNLDLILNLLRTLHLYTRLHYKLPFLAILVIAAYVIIAAVEKRARVRARRLILALCDGLRGMLVAVLVLLAALALWNYVGQGAFRYGRYFNAYEFYHYYLGSKYAREIGYTNLYNASLVADDETGLKYSNSTKAIRNLETGGYRPVESVLQEKGKYRALFSEARWQEWIQDIRWFKKELATGRWNGILRDKGYNASPVWSMLVGGIFSNQISTDSERGMQFLALLDLFLIVAAFLCVCWTFGPRVGLLMLVLLGTHYMMHFSHMKGALLRTDFAMSLVIAVCMVKRERYAIAGALVAYSSLARVFPAVYLFGLGAKTFWELVRMAQVAWDTAKGRWRGARERTGLAVAFLLPHLVLAIVLTWFLPRAALPFAPALVRPALWILSHVVLFPVCLLLLVLTSTGVWGLWKRRFDMRYVRFFLAFVITVALLVGASIAYDGGLDLWKDFASKIGRHNQDISPWRVGFKYVFIGRPDRNADLIAALHKLTDRTQAAQIQSPAAKKARIAQAGASRSGARWRAALGSLTFHLESKRYREYAGIWWIIQGLVLIFCLFAAKGLKDYEALAFSFVPTFFLVSPTYYYYIMLLAPFLFFAGQLERPSRALGLIMMFSTGMAGYVFYGLWQQKASTYLYLSWMILILVLYMMFLAMLETAWFGTRTARFRPAFSPMPPSEDVQELARLDGAAAETLETAANEPDPDLSDLDRLDSAPDGDDALEPDQEM